MIIEDDIQPETPNNYAGLRFTEPLLRRFFAYHLGQITQTLDDPEVTFLNELFAGFDRFLAPGEPSIIPAILSWFREHKNIPVTINYPRQGIGNTYVSVVNGSEQEIESEAYLGDYGGEASYGTLTMGGAPAYTREVLSVPQKHQTNVYVATDDPNTTIYLYTVVKALLLTNKLSFDQEGGMRNLVVNGGDIEFRPDLFPEFAYFKVVSLVYDTNFDLPQQKRTTIGGLNLSLKAATDNYGTITEVPEDC